MLTMILFTLSDKFILSQESVDPIVNELKEASRNEALSGKGNRKTATKLHKKAMYFHKKRKYAKAEQLWYKAAKADPSWWKPYKFNSADDAFYPIGWTDDGKLAAIDCNRNENIGAYAFDLIIEAEARYDGYISLGYLQDSEGNCKSGLKVVWDKNIDDIYDNLGKYSVIQFTDKRLIKKRFSKFQPIK